MYREEENCGRSEKERRPGDLEREQRKLIPENERRKGKWEEETWNKKNMKTEEKE